MWSHVLVDTPPVSSGDESVNNTPKSDCGTPRSRLQKRNERGETLLHTACIKGDVKVATSLISQGADINTTDNAGEWSVCEWLCVGPAYHNSTWWETHPPGTW